MAGSQQEPAKAIDGDAAFAPEIPGNHRSLFGESEVIAPKPLIMEENPTVIPRHVNSRDCKDWDIRYSQGIFNAKGDHIKALNDMRGKRRLFCPAERLVDAVGDDPADGKGRKFMVDGGTLEEHFGDMLLAAGCSLEPTHQPAVCPAGLPSFSPGSRGVKTVVPAMAGQAHG